MACTTMAGIKPFLGTQSALTGYRTFFQCLGQNAKALCASGVSHPQVATMVAHLCCCDKASQVPGNVQVLDAGSKLCNVRLLKADGSTRDPKPFQLQSWDCRHPDIISGVYPLKALQSFPQHRGAMAEQNFLQSILRALIVAAGASLESTAARSSAWW